MNLLKKLFAPIDMTQGAPWKQITLFAIPMGLSDNTVF